MAENLRARVSRVAFETHADEKKVLIRNNWMLKVKPNPQLHTDVYSATVYSLAKWRRQMEIEGSEMRSERCWKSGRLVEKRRPDRDIKRLVRERAHLRRKVAVTTCGRTPARAPRIKSLADVAARMETVHAAPNDAGRLGKELNLRDFTEFFAAKLTPKSPIALRRHTLPREMENLYRHAIRKAKKGRRTGRTECRYRCSRFVQHPSLSSSSEYSLQKRGCNFDEGLGPSHPHSNLQEEGPASVKPRTHMVHW